MASRLIEPTIVAVLTADEMAAPTAPEPSSVWGQLAPRIENGAALVLLSRDDFRYTLAIDQDWLTFATNVRDQRGHDVVDGIGLPRSVVKAVVEGWPEDWMQWPDRRCSVSYGDDTIPHLAVKV